jgi:NAD(P)H-nitrite reductase large subunit
MLATAARRPHDRKQHRSPHRFADGIGVRLQTALAEGAGIGVDRGVTVDPYLETSNRGALSS